MRTRSYLATDTYEQFGPFQSPPGFTNRRGMYPHQHHLPRARNLLVLTRRLSPTDTVAFRFPSATCPSRLITACEKKKLGGYLYCKWESAAQSLLASASEIVRSKVGTGVGVKFGALVTGSAFSDCRRLDRCSTLRSDPRAPTWYEMTGRRRTTPGGYLCSWKFGQAVSLSERQSKDTPL